MPTRRPVLLLRRTPAVKARRAVRGAVCRADQSRQAAEVLHQGGSILCCGGSERSHPSRKVSRSAPIPQACERADVLQTEVSATLRVAQTCCSGTHAATQTHPHACNVYRMRAACLCTGARSHAACHSLLVPAYTS